MSRSLLIILLSFPAFVSAQRLTVKNNLDTGYEIRVQLKPYKNQLIGFGHYFGSEFSVNDSAYLDENGIAVFSGNKPLREGIYLVFMYGENTVVNFLVGTQQKYSVFADFTESSTPKISFAGSPENDSFYAYREFKAGREDRIRQAQYDLAAARDAQDSSAADQRLDDIAGEINNYRKQLIRRFPDSFLGTLLSALNEPEVPAILKHPANAKDSSAQQSFIKEHFWDDVHFWDGRLAYTTFFADKIDKYFTEVLDQNSDSVIRHVDHMMGFAANNEDMSRLLLSKLLYGSMYHHYKWEDTVFVHLFENFVAGRSYSWMLDAERSAITERAYFLMQNIKGRPAENIELPGPDSGMRSLFDVHAKYTLVCFWDPTCYHCRETLPVLDSVYHAKWAAGLKVFAVAVETEGKEKDWLDFITAHHVQDWTNVYYSAATARRQADAGRSSCIQDYDVWYYPSFYLLDQDKHFMARKLSYKQISALLETMVK